MVNVILQKFKISFFFITVIYIIHEKLILINTLSIKLNHSSNLIICKYSKYLWFLMFSVAVGVVIKIMLSFFILQEHNSEASEEVNAGERRMPND